MFKKITVLVLVGLFAYGVMAMVSVKDTTKTVQKAQSRLAAVEATLN